MELTGRHICITGGGGFVGSHLADKLCTANSITVVDRFGAGRREWVPAAARIVEGDLRDPETVDTAITAETDFIFHLAADKAVNADDPAAQFEMNTMMTANVLSRAREVACDGIAFTSSSTVYGEAPRPTPESYAPLEPISMYGAAKLAEEGLCSVYAHNYGVQAWLFRFANVVGSRLQLGAVIPDFIAKLRDDPHTLEILGDGRQEKSYLYIDDCLSGMLQAIEGATDPVNIINLGTESTTAVNTIARIVADEMGLDPELTYTGGKRGWTGDVPRMRLAIDQLKDYGWEPALESDAAVRKATQELLEAPFSFD